MIASNVPAFPDSVEKRVYQVIISRLDGVRISEAQYRQRQFELIEKGIGGFILFGGVREEIKLFIAEMQSRSRIPLFIASDIERGVGQQVEGMTDFASQMAFAAAVDRSKEEDVDILHQAIEAISAEAKHIGINMPLIPVLDVNRDPDNPIICTRAFSDDPATAGWFGSRYIKTIEGQGVISCAKHFPGHGDTSTDSHISLPVIRKTKDNLMDVDISPFRAAIEAGVSSIMIGHLSLPAMDPRPASLSRKIITDLLRDELQFQGLVLTDALNMHALREFGDAGLECFKAGTDILLHPDDPDATANTLLSALEENRLYHNVLDTALKRIIKAKKRLRREATAAIDLETHSVLSESISQRAVTLVKYSAGLLPIGDFGKVHVIFAGEIKHFETSPLIDLTVHTRNATADDILLIALFTSVAAWKGSSGISTDERERLTGLIRGAAHSVVVSFGSPYVLRYFKDADVLIAAYDPSVQAQKVVMKCLRGEAPFAGRLPVHIPEVSPLG